MLTQQKTAKGPLQSSGGLGFREPVAGLCCEQKRPSQAVSWGCGVPSMPSAELWDHREQAQGLVNFGGGICHSSSPCPGAQAGDQCSLKRTSRKNVLECEKVSYIKLSEQSRT